MVPTRRRRRPGLPLFGVLAVALVVVLAAAVLVWRSTRDEPYVAAPPAGTGDAASSATASITLDRLGRAISRGDRDAALALAAAPDGADGDLVGALATNARRLHLVDVDLRYVSETSGVVDGSWTALVDVTWRFAGFDRTAATAEVPLVFADGGRSVLTVGTPAAPSGAVGTDGTASGDGVDTRVPTWMSGPLAVRRADDVLVLAAGGAGDADVDRWTQEAVTATDQVRAVLGGQPRLVVEVPSSAAALDAALGATTGTYANIAAVTAPVDGATGPAAPVHVFLNPDLFDDLDRTAAQVVVTHETVHVVTRASVRLDEPLWLIEGFADYVALRDVDLPLSVTAGQVAAEVRRRGVPDSLPSDAEFGTQETHLGASYEAAWQVCEVLADRGGEAALVSLYQRARTPDGFTAGLREGFDWTEADLVAAWQDRLSQLAG